MRVRKLIWNGASLLTLAALSASSHGSSASSGQVASGVAVTRASVANVHRIRLARLSRTLAATHKARILVIGSSSTVGVGATSPDRTYVARLEPDLEAALKGTDFVVIGHGMSGEVAQGAADRMKREVEDAKPDVVIWQVGTNDALGHVALESFNTCLKKTLAWLAEQHIDVVLLNPQYGDVLVKDAYYEEVVAAIADIARDANVL